MSHVSIELAEQLKKAGLECELRAGDCLSILYNRGCKSEYRKLVYLNEDDIEEYEETSGEVWLPSLSQLLVEIEKRGFAHEERTVIDESQAVDFIPTIRGHWIHAWSLSGPKREFRGCFDTPEDAAATALLCIISNCQKEGAPQ